MEFEIVKVVNGHEIKRYAGTRKPYFVNIEEENGVGYQEFHSFNTKKEAVKFLEEITSKTEPESEVTETATEPEETKKIDEFKVDKVVFLQKEKRIRVYKDNGIFDFDNFDDMAIELYMACLDALRAGKYEATEPEAEPEIAETEPETTEDTADQGETSESVTKQYECENVVQVAHKVADLTNTLCDREAWKGYCDEVKRDGSTWIDYTAFDTCGNEFDVSIFLGYDQQCRHYFVSVDYEKCPVPDMVRGA